MGATFWYLCARTGLAGGGRTFLSGRLWTRVTGWSVVSRLVRGVALVSGLVVLRGKRRQDFGGEMSHGPAWVSVARTRDVAWTSHIIYTYIYA